MQRLKSGSLNVSIRTLGVPRLPRLVINDTEEALLTMAGVLDHASLLPAVATAIRYVGIT